MNRFYDALENDDSSSITQGSDAKDNEPSASELKATSDVEIEAVDGSETALQYMQDPDSICEIQNDLDFETNSTTSECADEGVSSSLALGGHTKPHEVCVLHLLVLRPLLLRSFQSTMGRMRS